MNLLKRMLPLVKESNEARFIQHFPGPYVARQCNNESEGHTNFQTPDKLPILSLSQTLRPVATKSSSGSVIVSFHSEEEFCLGFCINEMSKQGKNPFVKGITFGRAANNDIVIPASTVSKFHAWIQKESGGDSYSCFDAGSSFGTLVNDEPIPQHQGRLLRFGAKVRLGDVSLTFLDAAGTFRWIKARLTFLKVKS